MSEQEREAIIRLENKTYQRDIKSFRAAQISHAIVLQSNTTEQH